MMALSGLLVNGLEESRLCCVSAGFLAHLTLDFMWQSFVILFWPLIGNFPLAGELGIFDYI